MYTKPHILGSMKANVAIQSSNMDASTKVNHIVDDALPALSTTAAYEADE